MKKKANLLVVLVILAIFGNISKAEDYFILAYGQNSGASTRAVFLKRINLDSATVIDSLIVSQGGYIMSKNPVRIYLNNQTILIPFVQDGGINKNSSGESYTIYYAMIRIDSLLNLLKIDSISNARLIGLKQDTGENKFRFSILADTNENELFQLGNYTINNQLNFIRTNGSSPEPWPQGIRNNANYKFLQRFNSPNPHNLCYAIGPDGGYWVVGLNNNRSVINDSLMLQTGLPVSTIFAYHPRRDKLYCIYLNYENHGKMEELEKNYHQNWSTPEVLIFDPNTFNLVERHSISDFTDGNYPGLEQNMADVVGDYIVYYFFQDEWMGRFYPAMLFIFDTRTNEARWLRVGWR